MPSFLISCCLEEALSFRVYQLCSPRFQALDAFSQLEGCISFANYINGIVLKNLSLIQSLFHGISWNEIIRNISGNIVSMIFFMY